MQFLDLISKSVPSGRLEAGMSWLRALVVNPTDPEVGLQYLRNLDGDLHGEIAQKLSLEPEGQRLLRERPRLDAKSLRLEELAKLPQGSLGHVFARYFREQRIKPFCATEPIANDADYITNRLRETHDLWHLVTGYGTHSSGELQLQAFSYGNLSNPSSLLILSFVPGAEVREGAPRLPGWLSGAHRRGRAARSLAGLYWEDHWETPLDELRADLNIV